MLSICLQNIAISVPPKFIFYIFPSICSLSIILLYIYTATLLLIHQTRMIKCHIVYISMQLSWCFSGSGSLTSYGLLIESRSVHGGRRLYYVLCGWGLGRTRMHWHEFWLEAPLHLVLGGIMLEKQAEGGKQGGRKAINNKSKHKSHSIICGRSGLRWRPRACSQWQPYSDKQKQKHACSAEPTWKRKLLQAASILRHSVGDNEVSL